jgi:hypothetical protein
MKLNFMSKWPAPVECQTVHLIRTGTGDQKGGAALGPAFFPIKLAVMLAEH